MMVIYLPIKFEFDWKKCSRVRVRKQNFDGRTKKNGQTNRQNHTNCKRKLAMMVIYLHFKFEFDWTKRFQVRVQK